MMVMIMVITALGGGGGDFLDEISFICQKLWTTVSEIRLEFQNFQLVLKFMIKPIIMM